jgi:hypothetical protein
MNSIVFFDLEVEKEKGKIVDVGGIKANGFDKESVEEIFIVLPEVNFKRSTT